MLFKSAEVDGIRAGEVTLAFRRWKRPSVKSGGTLRIPGGVLAIEAVDVIAPAGISESDARKAGRPSRADLLAELGKSEADRELYRVRFRLAGGDERVTLREQTDLSDSEIEKVLAALARLDRHGGQGAWTQKVLRAIATGPGVLAATLAAHLGYEKMWFKTHVRKLKALGLTESLETGYRISPRGREILARM